MLIDLQFILFMLIAIWLGFTDRLLQLVGSSFDKIPSLYLLLLWIGMVFVISIVFFIIFRTFKTFFKFLFKQLQ